jgi:hypothetical protein
MKMNNKEEERFMNAFNPQAIGFLRQAYAKVENGFSSEFGEWKSTCNCCLFA